MWSIFLISSYSDVNKKIVPSEANKQRYMKYLLATGVASHNSFFHNALVCSMSSISRVILKLLGLFYYLACERTQKHNKSHLTVQAYLCNSRRDEFQRFVI
ncbi:hypothetical protein SDJN03_07689, partial [Cucurbita argyrosperma subsp. sororia]